MASRRLVLVPFVVLVCGVGAWLEAQTIEIPLTTTMSGMSDNGRAVIVRVTNVSPKPATAWSFNTTFAYPDGRKQTINTSRDVYSALSPETKQWPLAPNASADTEVALPNADVPLTVEISPAAIVYLDRTADGEKTSIDEVFSRRRDDLEDLRDALLQLRESVGHGASRSSLARLRETLMSTPKHKSSVGSGLVINNIQAILAQNGVDQAQFARSVAAFVEMVTRTHQLAVEHSVRRQ